MILYYCIQVALFKFHQRSKHCQIHILNPIESSQVPPAEKDGVKVEQSVRMTKKRLSDDSDKTISDPESKVASVNDNEGIFVPHSIP